MKKPDKGIYDAVYDFHEKALELIEKYGNGPITRVAIAQMQVEIAGRYNQCQLARDMLNSVTKEKEQAAQ